MIDWVSGGLFITGATLALLAGVGVLRMPDVFTRMQASTKASTLGLGCLLAGVALRNPELAFVVRAASIAAFMVLTTAVAAHVIARAAARPVERGADTVMAVSPLADGALIRLAGRSVEDVGRTLRDCLDFLPSVLGDDPWTRKW